MIIYPLLTRGDAPIPPEGFFTLFRDKDNGALLTAKDSTSSFNVIGICVVFSEEAASTVEMANKIIDDAGCALQKGLISSLEYESITDNINICLTVDIDPVTGSRQTCVANEPTLFVSLVLTQVLCNGESTGTVTPTITGGTAPFTITYSGGADPSALPAGAFTITVVDDNGKTKLTGFIITEPPVLAGTISSPSAGTATVDITGGTPPFTFLWDDPGAQTTQTATGLAAGDFNCVITDANGCVLNLGPVTVS